MNHSNGVSPVIGVVLLIILVVGLSASAGYFVFGLGETSQDSSSVPSVSVTEKGDGTYEFQVVKINDAERVIVNSSAGPTEPRILMALPNPNPNELAAVNTNGDVYKYNVESLNQGTIVDFDGDNSTEAVYVNSTDSEIHYIDDDGTDVDLNIGAARLSFGAGDFDNDSDTDIAFFDGPGLTLKTTDSNGNVISTGVKAQRIGDIVDFDGDGTQEIVYRNDSTSKIHYVDKDGNDVSTSARATYLGASGDLDSDGDKDVVYVNASKDLYVRMIDSNGNIFNTTVKVDRVGGVDDVDNDGTLEFGYVNRSANDYLEFAEYDGSDKISTGKDLGLDIAGIGPFTEPGTTTKFSGTLNQTGDKITLSGLPEGTTITVIAQKGGSETVIKTIEVD